jgi:hypothetical protein
MCKVNASKDARTATAPFISAAFSSIHQTLQTTASHTIVGTKLIEQQFPNFLATHPILQSEPMLITNRPVHNPRIPPIRFNLAKPIPISKLKHLPQPAHPVINRNRIVRSPCRIEPIPIPLICRQHRRISLSALRLPLTRENP